MPAVVDVRRRCRDAARTAQRVAFDALVLATGSRAFLPPIEGIEHAVAFRTRHDVRTIRGRTHGARRAVVIGGGLLGLEAARAVANRGIAVTVVHLADRLMERQLDRTAGRMLERALKDQGSTCSARAPPPPSARIASSCSSGEVIEADLVIVAAGVVPEVALAQRMGLEVGRGVLVDDSLRTSVPGVWAVGECAEHRGQLIGLVAPALAMARAAGADVAGVPGAYQPGPVATKLKVAGIDLLCSGELEGDDEVVMLDTREGYYRREVYRGERARRADRARRGAGGRGVPPIRSSAPATASSARRSRRARASRRSRRRTGATHRLRELPREDRVNPRGGGRGWVPGRTARTPESD